MCVCVCTVCAVYDVCCVWCVWCVGHSVCVYVVYAVCLRMACEWCVCFLLLVHTDAAISCLPPSVCVRTVLPEAPRVHPQPCRPAPGEQASLRPCSPRPLAHRPAGRLSHHLCLPRSTPSMHLVAQSCLTPGDPIDCSPPGSSVHGILQARTLEWVAISSSRDLPNPGIEPTFPAFQADY